MKKGAPWQPLYCGPDWQDIYRLPPAAFKVWWFHYSHERQNNRESWPSIEYICEKCNLSKNTVVDARRWLVDHKWLVKVGERRVEGRFSVPIFRVECGTVPQEMCDGRKKNRVRIFGAPSVPKKSDTVRTQNFGQESEQYLSTLPPASGGVGVGLEVEGVARSTTSRNADAFADARPVVVPNGEPKIEDQPQTQPESEVEAPVPDSQVPPVGMASKTPTPNAAAPLPDAEMEEQAKAYFEVPANYLATYLWSFLQHRPDVEVIRPWEKFWIADFDKALSDGYSKEDIELAILCSQAGKARELYKRALSICNQLPLLIEKGRKLRDRAVLQEHACKCGALFAMLEDLTEHQETCETALAIDPEDAAEEEAMYAAEDLIGYGEVPDPLPDFDPFADTRECEDWQ